MYIERYGYSAQNVGRPVVQAAALLNRTPTQKILDSLGGLRFAAPYNDVSQLTNEQLAQNAKLVKKAQIVPSTGRSESDELFGQYIIDFTNQYVQTFAKDTEYNSVARFGVNLIGTLRAYQEAGKLAGTRLDATSMRLADALTTWQAVEYASGFGKEIINKETEGQTDSLLSLIINDTPTEDEKKLFDDIRRTTRTIHGSYDTNDKLLRSFSEITPYGTYEPATSVLHPVKDQYKFGNELWREKNKSVEKAAERAFKK